MVVVAPHPCEVPCDRDEEKTVSLVEVALWELEGNSVKPGRQSVEEVKTVAVAHYRTKNRPFGVGWTPLACRGANVAAGVVVPF